jgi:hypothetical protein
VLEYKVKRNGEIPVIFLWFIQSPALRDMPLRAVGTKGPGGDRPPPPFILTNEITLSQQGVQIMPTTLLLAPPPLIFRPSYGPAVATVYRPLCVATDTVGQKTEKKAVILLLFFEMQFLSQKLNCCQGNLFKGGILIKTEGIYLCEMKLSIKCQNETKPGFQLVKLLLCQVFKKP